MRKLFALLLIFSFGFSTVSAQDLLVKRDGSSTRVKVLSINKKKIKYVRFMTESPVYTLPVSDISYIEYPDGEREYYDESAKPKEPQKWHGALRPAVPIDSVAHRLPTDEEINHQNYIVVEDSLVRWHGPVGGFHRIDEGDTSRRYELGDIYNVDGVTGMVILTTDNGRHGTIVSLEETVLAWCSLPRRDWQKTGATSATDGQKNMEAISKYIANNSLSWSDFPAFEWCRNKGEGWYLPSVNEVWLLGTIFNGGSRVTFLRKARRTYNDTLKNNGGKPLNSKMLYHSSTEATSAKSSMFSHMGTDKPYIDYGGKGDKIAVRAFYKF